MSEEDPPLYPKEVSGREKISLEEFLLRTINSYRKITGKGISELLIWRIGTIYEYLEKLDPKPLPCRTLTQLVRNEKSFRFKPTSIMDGNLIRNERCRISSRKFFNQSLERNTTHKAVKICLNICEVAGTIRRIFFDNETVYVLSYEPIKPVLDVKEIHTVMKDFKFIETEVVTLLENIHKLKGQLSSSL